MVLIKILEKYMYLPVLFHTKDEPNGLYGLQII